MKRVNHPCYNGFTKRTRQHGGNVRAEGTERKGAAQRHALSRCVMQTTGAARRREVQACNAVRKGREKIERDKSKVIEVLIASPEHCSEERS